MLLSFFLKVFSLFFLALKVTEMQSRSIMLDRRQTS